MFHAYMHASETQCGRFTSWKSPLTFFILFLQVVIICCDCSQLFKCTRHLSPTYSQSVSNNNSNYVRTCVRTCSLHFNSTTVAELCYITMSLLSPNRDTVKTISTLLGCTLQIFAKFANKQDL